MKQLFLQWLDRLGLSRKIPRKHLEDFVRRHAHKGRTLDVGSRGAPYAKYFPRRIGIDIVKSSGVDIVADAHDLSMFQEGEFDCVLCTEVLEHLHTPPMALEEIHRVLKKGGKLILTTRFIFPLHDIPGDYWRFTRYGLEYLLSKFRILEIEEEVKTMKTFAVLLQRLAFQSDTLFFKPFSVVWLIMAKIVGLFSFLITKEYGDVTRKTVTKNIMTSGYYIFCEK